MAVGPVSRLPITPLPDSRSLVPVSAVRAPTKAGKADREAAKRVSKLSDDEFDKATAEARLIGLRSAPLEAFALKYIEARKK